MQRAADAPRPAFTARQGQFLAFIHTYTLVNGRPPAEADMMRFFRLTPPSVHQMVLTLEKAGLISRQPGVARSIVVLLDRSALPALYPGYAQPVKTSVQRSSVGPDRGWFARPHPRLHRSDAGGGVGGCAGCWPL